MQNSLGAANLGKVTPVRPNPYVEPGLFLRRPTVSSVSHLDSFCAMAHPRSLFCGYHP
jgi:hypothetical protein